MIKREGVKVKLKSTHFTWYANTIHSHDLRGYVFFPKNLEEFEQILAELMARLIFLLNYAEITKNMISYIVAFGTSLKYLL